MVGATLLFHSPPEMEKKIELNFMINKKSWFQDPKRHSRHLPELRRIQITYSIDVSFNLFAPI